MRLLRFRVTKFRSVDDSGWIEVDDVTALIGTNESGKTNLLLPLWKLNPANEGEINLTTDYPRKLFNTLRGKDPQPVFIEAVLEPTEDLLDELVALSGSPAEMFDEITVSRRFDGMQIVGFPSAHTVRSVATKRVLAILDPAHAEIRGAAPLKSEQELKTSLIEALAAAQATVKSATVDRDALQEMRRALAAVVPAEPAKTSVIVPRYAQALELLDELTAEVSK
jgi:ABC-type cobalamin/Fe3+-siderophores transport system ATPase subunit